VDVELVGDGDGEGDVDTEEELGSRRDACRAMSSSSRPNGLHASPGSAAGAGGASRAAICIGCTCYCCSDAPIASKSPSAEPAAALA
jgi:hypothetical protein